MFRPGEGYQLRMLENALNWQDAIPFLLVLCRHDADRSRGRL